MKKLESMLLEHFKRQGLSYIELNVITGNLLGRKAGNHWAIKPSGTDEKKISLSLESGKECL